MRGSSLSSSLECYYNNGDDGCDAFDCYCGESHGHLKQKKENSSVYAQQQSYDSYHYHRDHQKREIQLNPTTSKIIQQ